MAWVGSASGINQLFTLSEAPALSCLALRHQHHNPLLPSASRPLTPDQKYHHGNSISCRILRISSSAGSIMSGDTYSSRGRFRPNLHSHLIAGRLLLTMDRKDGGRHGSSRDYGVSTVNLPSFLHLYTAFNRVYIALQRHPPDRDACLSSCPGWTWLFRNGRLNAPRMLARSSAHLL